MHAKLEAHITLQYVQCESHGYVRIEKLPVDTTRYGHSAHQILLMSDL